jgi:hypothetical protein
MATVPVPRTWLNGEFVTDSIMNGSTGVRDAMTFLLDPPGCQLRRTTAGALTATVPQAVIFDSEDYDNDNLHSLVTNPSRITIVTPGRYQFWGIVPFDAATSGTREARLFKNGTTDLNGGRTIDLSATAIAIVINPIEVAMLAGDFMELRAVASTAVNTTAINSLFPVFGCRWRGL